MSCFIWVCTVCTSLNFCMEMLYCMSVGARFNYTMHENYQQSRFRWGGSCELFDLGLYGLHCSCLLHGDVLHAGQG